MSDDVDLKVARLEQRVDDQRRALEAIGPVVTTAAELKLSIGHLQATVDELDKDIASIRAGLEARDKTVSDERKATRTALYSLVGVLVAALVSGGAAIAVALIGG